MRLNPFIVDFDLNGGATPKVYILGDPHLLVEKVHNLTGTNNPFSDSLGDPAITKLSFGPNPVHIGYIDYFIKAGSVQQFASTFGVLSADIDGSGNYESLLEMVANAKTNSETDLVRRLDLSQKPIELSEFSCIRLDIIPGAQVTLSLTPVEVGKNGRNCQQPPMPNFNPAFNGGGYAAGNGGNRTGVAKTNNQKEIERIFMQTLGNANSTVPSRAASTGANPRGECGCEKK